MINNLVNILFSIILIILILYLINRLKIEKFSLDKAFPDNSDDCIKRGKCKNDIELYWKNLENPFFSQYKPAIQSMSIKHNKIFSNIPLPISINKKPSPFLIKPSSF